MAGCVPNSVSNDDNKFQFGGRSEFFLDNLRLGGAIVFNDSDASDKQLFSVFGGYVYENFTLLGDFTLVQHNSDTDPLLNPDERIVLLEANWHIKQGHNLKLTEEYHDPNINLKEDHRVRHSVIYEYTPFANLQIRFGVRIQNAPPQLPEKNTDLAFIQTHFYF